MDKVVTLSVILMLVGSVTCGYVVARLGWREACWGGGGCGACERLRGRRPPALRAAIDNKMRARAAGGEWEGKPRAARRSGGGVPHGRLVTVACWVGGCGACGWQRSGEPDACG